MSKLRRSLYFTMHVNMLLLSSVAAPTNFINISGKVSLKFLHWKY